MKHGSKNSGKAWGTMRRQIREEVRQGVRLRLWKRVCDQTKSHFTD